jgi:DNA-binding response OmpR family regulator
VVPLGMQEEERPKRILVVEDDRRIAEELTKGLRAAGFAIELIAQGAEVASRVMSGEFDLLLLDLMLPDTSGLEILEALRHRSSCPIIVLSAKADLQSRLSSFELGALDYVSKPFFLEELIQRIYLRLGTATPSPQKTTSWCNVVVFPDRREARVEDINVDLTRFEFNVLWYLIERRGRAATRDQIAERALSVLDASAARTVDSHVSRIRSKLGTEGAKALRTVWGVGYIFDPKE